MNPCSRSRLRSPHRAHHRPKTAMSTINATRLLRGARLARRSLHRDIVESRRGLAWIATLATTTLAAFRTSSRALPVPADLARLRSRSGAPAASASRSERAALPRLIEALRVASSYIKFLKSTKILAHRAGLAGARRYRLKIGRTCSEARDDRINTGAPLKSRASWSTPEHAYPCRLSGLADAILSRSQRCTSYEDPHRCGRRSSNDHQDLDWS